MSEIDAVIIDYLKAPKTDYAIMIDGVWGSGKSYYIHHHFTDLVKSIDTPAIKKWEKNKKYEPAYISLYGVSSAEDFECRVFGGIHSWSMTKLYKYVTFVVKRIGILKGLSLGKEDLLDFLTIRDNRVLVFDDLERICEEKISVKEVLGLINNYAEQFNHKVIIVCNESYYLSRPASEYKKYKEKSVRFTYFYAAEPSMVYDTLVKEIEDDSYRKFLVSQKTLIMSLFKSGSHNNLRTLKFFIDAFRSIFDISKGCKYKERILRLYVTSFMLYSIEYKNGHSSEELRSLDSSKYKLDDNILFGDEGEIKHDKNEEEKEFATDFAQKYHAVFADFHPNDIMINYIRSGFLDKNGMNTDISSMVLEAEKQDLLPEGIVYRNLLQMSILDDESVLSNINKMLRYVTEDKYNLYELLNIYALLMKYDYWGISGFKVTEDIDKDFKAAIERKKGIHQYDNMFDVKTPILDASDRGKRHFEKYNAMKDIAKSVNYQAKIDAESKEGKRFMEIAANGDIAKLQQYRAYTAHQIPISGIDWERITNLIENTTNPVACEICNCLISFIPSSGYLNPIETDRVKDELLPALNKSIESTRGRIRNIYITELKNHLERVLM